jgi:hypothetical protein
MADRTIDVLVPATETDILSLDEAKTLMGISLTDTSEDAQLAMWIDINSQTIARLCNRMFAYEQVCDTWREFQYGATMMSTVSFGHRIFLSHWPVDPGDIVSVEAPAGSGMFLDPSQWEIETASGKLSIFATTEQWTEPVAVTYSGGYNLPDEAPGPLKQATALLCVQSKLLASLGTMAGVRLLSHKDKRVAFHDPMKILEAAMGGKGSATNMAVMNMLAPYTRVEV